MFSVRRCIAFFPRYCWVVLLVPCCLLVGCSSGPKMVPVTGSITVNGKPAEGAMILLHSSDPVLPTTSAVAAADGSFSLVSGMESGVLTGTYKVTITWPDPSKKPTDIQIMMGTAELGPDLLKGKYATKETSTLSAEITETTTSLPPFAL